MRLALSARSYRRITLAAVLALAFITVSGAAVRLTGSGLGCSDWPTCEEDQFVAALDSPHAMVEFVNRMVTGAVSLAIIAAVLGALIRVPRRRDLLWWSLGLVVGLIGQILLGGMVVLLELTPVSVIGHFLLSMVLLWNALVLHDRAATAAGPAEVVAPRQVRRLTGVLGVSNQVTVKPRLTSGAIKTRIEEAFKRNAEIDADRVSVDIEGSAVTLRGTVRTWAEKQEAERVAWASPGVASVLNKLVIGG